MYFLVKKKTKHRLKPIKLHTFARILYYLILFFFKKKNIMANKDGDLISFLLDGFFSLIGATISVIAKLIGSLIVAIFSGIVSLFSKKS